ncbi:hypothetical protein H0H93_011424 [Arthromyces matolae]|nr:hypothetical protein H0H93_011424 [Arthromyces matolae]
MLGKKSWEDYYSLFFITALIHPLALVANPVTVRHSPVKLPLARRVNLTSVHNLIRHDLARIKYLHTSADAFEKNRRIEFDATASVIDESIDNQAVSYIASVGVGNPVTNCKNENIIPFTNAL